MEASRLDSQELVRNHPAEAQLPPRLGRYYQLMKKFARSAATTALIIAGLGLAGLGAATDAQAGPLPQYYNACPGHPHWSYSHCLSAHR